MMNVLDGRRRAVVDDQNMLAMISVEKPCASFRWSFNKKTFFVYLLHIMEVPRLAGSSLPMDEEDTWRSVPSIYNSGLSQHFPDHDDILPHGRELLDYLGIGPSSFDQFDDDVPSPPVLRRQVATGPGSADSGLLLGTVLDHSDGRLTSDLLAPEVSVLSDSEEVLNLRESTSRLHVQDEVVMESSSVRTSF